MCIKYESIDKSCFSLKRFRTKFTHNDYLELSFIHRITPIFYTEY